MKTSSSFGFIGVFRAVKLYVPDAMHLNTSTGADKYVGLYIVRPVSFINFNNNLQSQECSWLNRHSVSGTPGPKLKIDLFPLTRPTLQNRRDPKKFIVILKKYFILFS